MLTRDELNALQNSNITLDNLVDIKKVRVDDNLSVIDRIENFIDQVRNPYYFLSGKTLIGVRFVENGKTLDDALLQHFLNEKNR